MVARFCEEQDTQDSCELGFHKEVVVAACKEVMCRFCYPRPLQKETALVVVKGIVMCWQARHNPDLRQADWETPPERSHYHPLLRQQFRVASHSSVVHP